MFTKKRMDDKGTFYCDFFYQMQAKNKNILLSIYFLFFDEYYSGLILFLLSKLSQCFYDCFDLLII